MSNSQAPAESPPLSPRDVASPVVDLDPATSATETVDRRYSLAPEVANALEAGDVSVDTLRVLYQSMMRNVEDVNNATYSDLRDEVYLLCRADLDALESGRLVDFDATIDRLRDLVAQTRKQV